MDGATHFLTLHKFDHHVFYDYPEQKISYFESIIKADFYFPIIAVWKIKQKPKTTQPETY